MDPNNQNYFSLGEPPAAPLPWWKQRKYQLRMVAGLGIAVGIGLVGYYAYQTYMLTNVIAEKVEQAQTMIGTAQASCATEKDPADCERRARADAARATGQASVCESLTGKEFKSCVSLIAFDTADPDVCALLESEYEQGCRNTTMLIAAKKAKDYGMCDDIQSVDTQASCRAQLLNVVVAAGECQKYGIDQGVCDYPAKRDAVIASGNPSGCIQFTDAQRTECEYRFEWMDQDKDGLTLLEEYKLGTSDTNADTDGDGYTDNQEVDSGNDPLK